MMGAFVSSLYFRFALHGPIAPQPNPLLDWLLARADPGSRVSDWREDAFCSLASPGHSMPRLAAVALYALQGALESGWVCVATPVHYLAEMSNVRLARNGILTLTRTQAEMLSLDFNRVWHDAGIRMQVGRFGELLCIFDRALQVCTRDPEEVIDRHIEEYLPRGDDAPLLRRLMSEVEMWLFEHAVNGTRSLQDALPVNGLWLWGGGAVASPPAVQGCAEGEDVLFNYFRGDVSNGGVIVAPQPGSGAWQQAESRWLEPAVQRLRAGRIAKLVLSAGDRCFNVTARGLWRFWRRPTPWWEHFV
jgi:hypothetical protein